MADNPVFSGHAARSEWSSSKEAEGGWVFSMRTIPRRWSNGRVLPILKVLLTFDDNYQLYGQWNVHQINNNGHYLKRQAENGLNH
jgi:hypothetical protein